MPDLSYDSNRPLFLFDDNQRFTLADADQCIAAAYAKNLPVLVYLHGRAKDVGEPKKSVENGTYTALSQEYKVTVIGFTWDADDGGYDESRPIASADDFVVFLSALRKHIAHTQAPLPS